MPSLCIKRFTGANFSCLVPDRAPPNVSARNLSATEVLVKWEPLPKESYHSVLLAYRINISTNEINFTRIINVPPNTTNHRVTGLDTYTRYVVSVAAVNDVGQGVYSDDVIVWTEEGGKLIFLIYQI